MTQRRFEVALFALGFAMAGLVIAALLWSGDAPYADIARDNGATRFVFVVRSASGGTHTMDLASAADVHARWARYVTGGTAEPPRFEPPLFGEDEYAHMSDVRRVFDGAKILVPAGLFVMAIRLQRARQRGAAEMSSLARDGAFAAAAAVVAVGVAAAVAFEPAFLLFHRIVFPQGNYLFDPATSNLVRLYPDWYWQGITFRVGASFVAVAALVAAAASWRLRAALH